MKTLERANFIILECQGVTDKSNFCSGFWKLENGIFWITIGNLKLHNFKLFGLLEFENIPNELKYLGIRPFFGFRKTSSIKYDFGLILLFSGTLKMLFVGALSIGTWKLKKLQGDF